MTCNKIICVNELPKEDYKLFFGDSGNFLRVDKVHYATFQKLYEKGFSDFWTHKVVNFDRDAIGWSKLPEVAKRMFLLNNGYQELMDSGVVNLYNYLTIISSNPELSILYQYIAQNESIHALSYSYGLAQMFGANAEEKINIVYEDKFVQRRLQDEVDFSDEFIDYVIIQKKSDLKAKILVLKVILATYFLEHIKFPFSFLVTWRINEGYDNAIQGFTQLLKLIAWDELTTHAPTNANVLKILKKEERQGFQQAYAEIQDFIKDYVTNLVKKELEWNKYLFSEGNINSFTEEQGANFIKYYANKALTTIKEKELFKAEKTDLISWYEDYRNINGQNAALQEVSNIAYQKGITANDLHKFDEFKGF